MAPGPIKEKMYQEALYHYFDLVKKEYLALYKVGINYPIDVIPLFNLKASDINDTDDRIKDILYEHVKEFEIAENDYLFTEPKNKNKPMSTLTFYRALNKAAKLIHYGEKISIESLRKTYYYNLFIKGTDFDIIKHELNHINGTRTKKYLQLTNMDYSIHYKHKEELEGR